MFSDTGPVGGSAQTSPLMRSVFPALHDRYLTALLCGAVVLLAAAIIAITVSDRDADGAIDNQHSRNVMRITGASPAN